MCPHLKLRASWGQLGNDKIPNFQYLQFYNLDDSYIFGETKERTLGLNPGTTPNPNITWETAEKTNIGIDISLRKSLLNGTIEFFHEKRSDILAPRNASVPIYSGILLPDENIGKVKNSGLELQLNHHNKLGQVNYHIGGQFTYAKSKIIFIDEADNIPEWQKRTGHPIDFLFLYEADGLFQDWDEINSTAHFPDAKPGDVKFVDKK